MSGETEASVSGWTVDTLREHLAQRLDAQRDALRQEIEAQRDFTRQQIGDLRDSSRIMTTDLRESVRNQAGDHSRLLDERYATQTKALDAAFKAAEQAVAVALANAEKATAKAEAAADKRFEAVNEFRAALADQTAGFLPRVEYETSRAFLAERITAAADRVAALELRLTSRLDLGEGSDKGVAEHRNDQRLNLSQVIAALAVLVAIMGFVLYAMKR